MKKILSLVLVLIMVLGLAACGGIKLPLPSQSEDPASQGEQQPEQTPSVSGGKALVAEAGDKASFGSYGGKPIEWIALEVDEENKKALLVTTDCIRLDVWNESAESGEQVVWADCSLRAWLNGEFYNGLSAAEQAIILDTKLDYNNNNGFCDYPEEDVEWKTTTDKVFLLSGGDVKHYYGEDSLRVASLVLSESEMAATFERYLKIFNYVDEDGTVKSDMYALNNQPIEYWLRSNGRGYMAQIVLADGAFDDCGSNQDATFKGVRPAIWISLEAQKEETQVSSAAGEISAEQLYESWGKLSGYWNSTDDREFVALDMKDSHSAVFSYGLWETSAGRGFGDVTEIVSGGENIIEVTVYYPATEANEMDDAMPELIKKVVIDYSGKDTGGTIKIKVGEEKEVTYYYGGIDSDEAYQSFSEGGNEK